MVNAFEFASAGRIVFGEGTVRELASAAKAFGSRALVVCGGSTNRAERALHLLRDSNIEAVTFNVPHEPELALVQSGADLARRERCEVVVGIGGGSVIDAAKAIAALVTNTRDMLDYLEVIGRAQPLSISPLPIIAIPTTAGTGSEVTRNAVLSSKEHRVKVSLRSAGMLPRVAIVDPELTRELPPALTASTGMDALTQVIEPFVSVRANPIADALCRDAIPRAARALPRAVSDGSDTEARRDMALASLFGGLALANAGLGAVHGFAAPIGGMFDAPHGGVCASLLAEVMETNHQVARANQVGETVARYRDAARLLTGRDAAHAEDGIAFVRELCATLCIPRLRDFAIPQSELPAIAEKAAQSNSMKGNPVALTHIQLTDILERAW